MRLHFSTYIDYLNAPLNSLLYDTTRLHKVEFALYHCDYHFCDVHLAPLLLYLLLHYSSILSHNANYLL